MRYTLRPTKRVSETHIKPGAVVSLEGSNQLLSVETIETTPFGTVARCVWFDDRDCLRFESIPTARLGLFAQPSAELATTEAGRTLRLRSLGPVMSVVRPSHMPGLVLCEWDGPEGQVRRRAFDVRTLSGSFLSRPERPNGAVAS